MTRVEGIAEIIHEANRALQRVFPSDGIPVALPWAQESQEQRDSIINGVQLAMRGATPEEMHDNWMRRKVAEGWVGGAVKDEVAKIHPCICPYDQLPETDRVKDRLFLAIVGALT